MSFKSAATGSGSPDLEAALPASNNVIKNKPHRCAQKLGF